MSDSINLDLARVKLLYVEWDYEKGTDYIGVTCVFYCHDGKGNFVLHKSSKNCKDEQSRWDVGRGSLEVGETWEETVKREVKEEYCTEVLGIKFAGVTNVLRQNGEEKTHWIALIFLVLVDRKKVKIGESTKMDKIGWFAPNNRPNPPHSCVLKHFEMAEKILKSSWVVNFIVFKLEYLHEH
jgi:8-oxo-dGTP diphosphatase